MDACCITNHSNPFPISCAIGRRLMLYHFSFLPSFPFCVSPLGILYNSKSIIHHVRRSHLHSKSYSQFIKHAWWSNACTDLIPFQTIRCRIPFFSKSRDELKCDDGMRWRSLWWMLLMDRMLLSCGVVDWWIGVVASTTREHGLTWPVGLD